LSRNTDSTLLLSVTPIPATTAPRKLLIMGAIINTTRYLAQVMSVPPLNISSSSRPEGEYDILIILGADWRQIIDPE
jgi:hypothetical protein